MNIFFILPITVSFLYNLFITCNTFYVQPLKCHLHLSTSSLFLFYECQKVPKCVLNVGICHFGCQCCLFIISPVASLSAHPYFMFITLFPNDKSIKFSSPCYIHWLCPHIASLRETYIHWPISYCQNIIFLFLFYNNKTLVVKKKIIFEKFVHFSEQKSQTLILQGAQII